MSTMRISDQRRKLDEKGLDIDGSRETLISALKENRTLEMNMWAKKKW